MPSIVDVAWKLFRDSLSPSDRWSHCGSREHHDRHTHVVTLNEGSCDAECPGTPTLTKLPETATHRIETTVTTPSRPSWDDFFIGQLSALAKRATCDRGRSAAIFVRDHDQLAAGYVGSPPGQPHCDDVGHLWDETGKHCLRTIHAEQNAMLRALRHGISLRDTTVYCTMVPCFTCAKLMVGVGVYRVVALHSYHDGAPTRDLFADASVALVVLTDTRLYVPERDTMSAYNASVVEDAHDRSVLEDEIARGIVCPTHLVRFTSIAKKPNGDRLCPHGETWIMRHGSLINLSELEWGEQEKL